MSRRASLSRAHGRHPARTAAASSPHLRRAAVHRRASQHRAHCPRAARTAATPAPGLRMPVCLAEPPAVPCRHATLGRPLRRAAHRPPRRRTSVNRHAAARSKLSVGSHPRAINGERKERGRRKKERKKRESNGRFCRKPIDFLKIVCAYLSACREFQKLPFLSVHQSTSWNSSKGPL